MLSNATMKVCEKVVSVTKDEMIEQLLQQVASLTTTVDNQTQLIAKLN